MVWVRSGSVTESDGSMVGALGRVGARGRSIAREAAATLSVGLVVALVGCGTSGTGGAPSSATGALTVASPTPTPTLASPERVAAELAKELDVHPEQVNAAMTAMEARLSVDSRWVAQQLWDARIFFSASVAKERPAHPGDSPWPGLCVAATSVLSQTVEADWRASFLAASKLIRAAPAQLEFDDSLTEASLRIDDVLIDLDSAARNPDLKENDVEVTLTMLVLQSLSCVP